MLLVPAARLLVADGHHLRPPAGDTELLVQVGGNALVVHLARACGKRAWPLIAENEHVARIEQPIYKRRWVPPDYEKEFAGAFKWWLREKAEFYLEHGAGGGPVSLEEWAAALWKDPRVRAAAEVFHGAPLASAKQFEAILKDAVEEETVPDDETAFKPRHRQLHGKLNVPRERFRSVTSKPGYYIWAGK